MSYRSLWAAAFADEKRWELGNEHMSTALYAVSRRITQQSCGRPGAEKVGSDETGAAAGPGRVFGRSFFIQQYEATLAQTLQQGWQLALRGK